MSPNSLLEPVIKGWKHKGLKELFEKGSTAKIQPSFHRRILYRLVILNRSPRPEAMNVPGFDFHALKGNEKHSVHVNGPWCITFEFDEGDAYRVDLNSTISAQPGE